MSTFEFIFDYAAKLLWTVLKQKLFEIEVIWGQFHQRFTSSCLRWYSFAEKLQSQTVPREKLRRALSYE